MGAATNTSRRTSPVSVSLFIHASVCLCPLHAFFVRNMVRLHGNPDRMRSDSLRAYCAGDRAAYNGARPGRMRHPLYKDHWQGPLRRQAATVGNSLLGGQYMCHEAGELVEAQAAVPVLVGRVEVVQDAHCGAQARVLVAQVPANGLLDLRE